MCIEARSLHCPPLECTLLPAMALAAFAHLPHRELDRDELRRLAEELSAREDLWRHLIRHDCVERTYESLVQTEHVEVWVNCWMRDHDTGFHDHDLAAGAVAVIAGQVREERLALGGPVVSRTFRPGNASTSGRPTSTGCSTPATRRR